MKTYKEFYKDITGFYPYHYQEKVAELLLEGKNVILSVPTGAGKTWASIIPFLYAQYAKTYFPSKLIYSLPLRTLANSIYSDVNKVLRNLNGICIDSDSISIQTGEYKDDPYFENDIIFSTIDQTLSNFLCFPLSLSHSQANINAGALVGSYLIFDEFHLLDANLSMSTSLGIIRILKNLSRVCIMTATMTDEYITFLKECLPNFEVVSINDFQDDIPLISSLLPSPEKDIKKAIFVEHETISAQEVLKYHKNRSIVICNRVERAQQIFIELKTNRKEGKTICLHSRFFDSDRKKIEGLVKNYFGRDSFEEDVILVSTQVIEAGMDISCDTLFTEISPINSFLQRAGRCARFAYEYGEIHVYDVLSLDEKELIEQLSDDDRDKKEIRKLNNKYLPYSEALCKRSISSLEKYHHIDEKVSAELINEVLSEEEKNASECISSGLYNIEKIRMSWEDCDVKHYGETIRDVQSAEVALFNLDHCNGECIIPWKYETISVYKWSLVKWVKQIEESLDGTDDKCPICACAENSYDSQFDFEWNENDTFYLKKLSSDDLKLHHDPVFINNRFFSYNKDVGLTVQKATVRATSPVKDFSNEKAIEFEYNYDTFIQHNSALLSCYCQDFEPKLGYLFNELNKYVGSNDWNKLMKMAICFHDLGKLNYAWQTPMLEYQRRKTGNLSCSELIAHTDYNEKTDKQLAVECGINKKPPHAGIGAMQLFECIYDEYPENVSKAIACSVLKHHSVENDSFVDFQIPKESIKLFSEFLLAQSINISNDMLIDKEKGGKLPEIQLLINKHTEWLLYFVFVRYLRLADQKATSQIEKYIER